MEDSKIQNDLVTTIIPVYNRPELLKRSVQSVLDQTYRPIEIIIVDDGSTDETLELCEKYKGQYPTIVRIIHKKHEGKAGLARESGRRMARGAFIQYLDSDDILTSRKFEVMVKALKDNPDCGIAYCYTRRYREGAAPQNTPYRLTGETVKTMYPRLLSGRFWHIVTPLFRRVICDIAGPWSDLTCEEDWEYETRIAMQNVKLCHCKDFLADVIDHNKPRMTGKRLYDAAVLKERQRAYKAIYRNAVEYGILPEEPNMQLFSRYLFLIARQCGAAGLATEALECFSVAVAAAGHERAKGWDFKLYGMLSSILGWKLSGQFACFIFDPLLRWTNNGRNDCATD